MLSLQEQINEFDNNQQEKDLQEFLELELLIDGLDDTRKASKAEIAQAQYGFGIGSTVSVVGNGRLMTKLLLVVNGTLLNLQLWSLVHGMVQLNFGSNFLL